MFYCIRNLLSMVDSVGKVVLLGENLINLLGFDLILKVVFGLGI